MIEETGIREVNSGRIVDSVRSDTSGNTYANTQIGLRGRIKSFNESQAAGNERAEVLKHRLTEGQLISPDDYRWLVEWTDGLYGSGPASEAKYELVRRTVTQWLPVRQVTNTQGA